MKQSIILSRLLDKYENSKHLFEPGVSTRRVMLRIEKKELPEYEYQEASVRDAFNQAAQELEKDHLVALEWVTERPVLSAIILNLDRVDACYPLVGRKHPKEQAIVVAQMIEKELSSVSTSWIILWRDELCAKAKNAFKLAQAVKDLSEDNAKAISKGLFRYAVQLEMLMRMIATLSEIDDDKVEKMRREAINNVRRTRGKVSLAEIITGYYNE